MNKYNPNKYFTVTLNSSDTSNADNKICRFETVLPRPRMLEGNWLVGLSEIQYTRSWFNITEDQTIWVTDKDEEPTPCPTKVKKGHYDNVDALVKAINTSLTSASKLLKDKFVKTAGTEVTPPSIKHIQRERSFKVVSGKSPENGELNLRMSAELAEMLGLKPLTKTDEYEKNLETNSESNEIQTDIIKGVANKADGQYQCYDLNRGIHSIFVYCNLIVPSYVGNSFSKLLRVVPVQNKPFGDQCSHVYPKPYFYPLHCNVLHKIEVVLRDHTGTTIPFEFGQSTIVLEFMKL